MKKSKITDLGSASQDDPIYSSVVNISFRPQISNQLINKTIDLTSNTSGRYAVFIDFLNWEGGSCLNSEESELIIGTTFEDIQMLYKSQIQRFASLAENECNKAKLTDDEASWRGMSGYTAYCAMYEAHKVLDREGWQNIFFDDGEDDHNIPDRYKLCNFWGCSYQPTYDRDFLATNIGYAEIKNLLIDKFS